ncbi:MAG TPA: uroporphyrinogen-III C-methyltransferase [Phototrophicaceae bacterium]|nr:uroporphyrinogen-III C-methyltransferase [Phototrophicaceae bacterium]
MTGTVYLIGAGPGDPGLITVKGMEALRRADVIIYDHLAPTELLREARPDAELIDGGKQPQKQRLSQSEINALIINRASKGLNVARLKGGDPFVFGRGGEEALACRGAGIPFVIVPGVSSAIAVPAYAGIPVTQRGLSTAFTVLTGHDESSVDYEALAKLGGTLVLLMGMNHLPQIVARLLDAGLAPDMPAASIEWGTTNRQRVIKATLATIVEQAADLQPPTTTIIGAVAALGLDWFDPGADRSVKIGSRED